MVFVLLFFLFLFFFFVFVFVFVFFLHLSPKLNIFRSFYYMLMCLKTSELMPSSVDPDQTPRSPPSVPRIDAVFRSTIASAVPLCILYGIQRFCKLT